MPGPNKYRHKKRSQSIMRGENHLKIVREKVIRKKIKEY